MGTTGRWVLGGAFVLAGIALSLAAGELRAIRGDVVLIRCDSVAAEFKLTAFQGSTGTPARKPGTCTDNLSLLLKDGFTIRDIGQHRDDDEGFVIFTLER